VVAHIYNPSIGRPRKEDFKFKASVGYIGKPGFKKKKKWHQRLTPVILATREAEIRRISVKSQPKQIVLNSVSQKYPAQKNRPGGMAQVI
jgi:hypothetical protein